MKHSEETKLKIGLANKGRKLGKMSEEQKKKISDALKGKIPKFIPNNKGRKHSKKWIEKIQESRKWYKPTEETKRKISESHKGNKNYNWQKDNPSYRAVHDWVKKQKGIPKKCEHCGATNRKHFHWANISQEYKRELLDWVCLCVPCHSKYDRTHPNSNYKKYGI